MSQNHRLECASQRYLHYLIDTLVFHKEKVPIRVKSSVDPVILFTLLLELFAKRTVNTLKMYETIQIE